MVRGGQGRVPPQLHPQAATTLPPQQYSRSRRHWVSRTCPLLHTCPESGLTVLGGDVGLPMGQLWGRVVSYLHAEVGVWPQPSKLLWSL